ncbi:MAG TPA: hypothetical protein VEC06_18275 [Paucimonas sp.]|nr:hypothetical protein [Paucimonas sp.]
MATSDKHKKISPISAQRGVVIVENLVAVLIFAVGMLGLVGLLAASIKNVSAARYRNDASLLANQIIGQMWADDKSNAALKKNYASPDGAQYLTWKSSVSNALPGVADNPPTVEIDKDNVVTVTLRWKEPGASVVNNFAISARING